ncbi:MAG: ABC transporter permease [Micromonosporaceae bacterium]
MTTLHLEEIAESTTARGFWTRSRKAGALFVVLGLAAAVVFGYLSPGGLWPFGVLPPEEVARFSLVGGELAVPLPARPAAIGFGLVTAAAGVLLLTRVASSRLGLVTGIALVAFVMSFLCWQVAGEFMPLVAMASGTLFLALPLIFGSLSGVLCERAGVINIGIEGQFLMGAFAGAMFATLTGSPWVGLLAAAFGGLLIASLLGVFAIRYLVDQIVLGVVLVVLAVGVTGFLYERLMQPYQESLNKPPGFGKIAIPLLSDIPLIGPVLFDANVIVYLAFALVVVVHLSLFHTRWGMRVRAVGEHPTAADTVGINVRRVRYLSVLAGGLVAGIGGASFTLGSGLQFTKVMTDGKGFIALAAMIFGRYSPTGALAAAVLFGFADQLQIYLSGIGSEIPSQFLAMAPYIATILAVAGLVGRVRPPAADGKPYVKG